MTSKNGLQFIPDCPVSKLIPYKRNPRLNNQAIKAVSESIGRFGAVAPIIVDKDFNIAAGHTRYKAALERGKTTFPVLVVPHLVGDEFKAYNIADNQTATLAEWDMPELAAIIKELEATEFPVDVLGFNDKELQEIMDSATGNTGLTDPDDVPEPPDEPVVKTGDLWLLGSHRLLCGDATCTEDVERLMAGKKAHAVLTDPPYGQNQPGVRGDIPEDLQRLINDTVRLLPINDAIVIAFQSPRTFPVWLDAIRLVGHKFERMLTLYKEAQCTYPWRGWILKSESILVSSVGVADWQDVRPYHHDVYSVVEVSHEIPDELGWHGSIKPIAVVKDILTRIVGEGKIVYDPFVGSGTTIIAAEQLGRKAYCLEIEPRYVEVAIRRWQQFTGQQAILEGTRKTFDQIVNEYEYTKP